MAHPTTIIGPRARVGVPRIPAQAMGRKVLRYYTPYCIFAATSQEFLTGQEHLSSPTFVYVIAMKIDAHRHSGEGRNPGGGVWTPAFTGVTKGRDGRDEADGCPPFSSPCAAFTRPSMIMIMGKCPGGVLVPIPAEYPEDGAPAEPEAKGNLLDRKPLLLQCRQHLPVPLLQPLPPEPTGVVVFAPGEGALEAGGRFLASLVTVFKLFGEHVGQSACMSGLICHLSHLLFPHASIEEGLIIEQ